MLVIAIVSGYLKEYLMSFLCITLHEAGHLLSAKLMGKDIFKIKLLPLGLNASFDENACSKKEKIIIFLSGPLINILLCIGYLLFRYPFNTTIGNTDFFITMNVGLFIFNMIPIMPLDGGRILKEFLTEKAGIFSAERYIRAISIAISILFILVGIVQITVNSGNISLSIVGVYVLMLIILEKSEAALMNVKHILFRRTRFLKKGIYPARELVVVKSTCLVEALKSMDFDRFHFINVLDEHMRLVKVFTEQEIIDNMIKYNPDMTFGELINISIQNTDKS